MKSIQNADIREKTVLVRTDFNVPIQRGLPSDTLRIKAIVPTVNYLLNQQAKQIILLSHLDRPGGKWVKEAELLPIARYLAKLFRGFSRPKRIVKEGFPAYQISERILLLENIRFYPEEEKNDASFARKLSFLGDFFVNDAFSCSHRAHASIEGITHHIPSFAGFALMKEVQMLSRILKKPKPPFVCLLGGIKVPDKIEMIEALGSRVTLFLLGGVMANTFLKAKGEDIKSSLFAEEKLDEAKRLLKKLDNRIVLPKDYHFGRLKGREAILDIGQATILDFCQLIKDARTIFWNGNLGMVEKNPYTTGSRKIAKAIIASGALSIVAGGDTIAFVDQLGLLKKFSFYSLGGGATIDFLAQKKLPGLVSLL